MYEKIYNNLESQVEKITCDLLALNIALTGRQNARSVGRWAGLHRSGFWFFDRRIDIYVLNGR